jgi:hypothetical protein
VTIDSALHDQLNRNENCPVNKVESSRPGIEMESPDADSKWVGLRIGGGLGMNSPAPARWIAGGSAGRKRLQIVSMCDAIRTLYSTCFAVRNEINPTKKATRSRMAFLMLIA